MTNQLNEKGQNYVQRRILNVRLKLFYRLPYLLFSLFFIGNTRGKVCSTLFFTAIILSLIAGFINSPKWFLVIPITWLLSVVIAQLFLPSVQKFMDDDELMLSLQDEKPELLN